jgi:DNA (cytosine-5)-methyltransferase 1
VNKIQVLDLFSGIGGFSLGLERAGFETVAFCEIDKYCRLVLQKHWKDIKIYSDVREIKKERLEADGIPSPDVITGGFPCQPFSVAGRRQGTGDNRYLWPEMFRIIKEFKPRWIIAENVRGIINIQDGVVFEGVHADLESQNYETQTFIIPAAGVGAPHRRDRVWVVAHSKFNGFPSSKKRKSTKETIPKESQGQNNSFNTTGTSGLSSSTKIMANSRRTIRGEQSSRNKESIGSGTSQKTERTFDRDSITGSSEREKIMANSNEGNVETGRQQQRGICQESEGQRVSSDASSSGQAMANSKRVYVQGQHDGSGKEQSRRGGWWEVEPNVGRVADGLPGRVHRLKGLGNSIVPQIAEEIGKAILKVDLIDRDSKA